MSLTTTLKAILRGCLSILPKSPKKIIFESEPDFSDNARAFYDYLIRNHYNDTHKLIWCVKNPKAFADFPEKNVVFTSFRDRRYLFSYLYYIATAKTVVYTHATPPFINTNKQTVACLWHGTPLKQMDYRANGQQPFTFLSSASRWCSESLADCFHIPIDMTSILGYPRCDQLFEENNALEALNISRTDFHKVILWMPTFRQSSQLNIYDAHETQTGLPLLETQDALLALNNKLREENLLLLIKLHPLQNFSGMDIAALSHVRLLTSQVLEDCHVQLYHLVSHADILLTDYSSIYFDFLLLDRPIGFIIDDIDEYRDKRGFVTDDPLSFMPGAKMKTLSGLYQFLDDVSVGKDDYASERARVNPLVNEYTDNRSSERLARHLFLRK